MNLDPDDGFFETFRANIAEEEKISREANNILDRRYPQSFLANFLKDGVVPTERPPQQAEQLEMNLQFISDIIVAHMFTRGELSSLADFCFLAQLTKMGAFQHRVINFWWNHLSRDQLNFYLMGTSILKSFVLAVKDIYFVEVENFMEAVLSKTDPYFHTMVKEVFEQQMFAQGGVLVGDM